MLADIEQVHAIGHRCWKVIYKCMNGIVPKTIAYYLRQLYR